MTFRIAQYGLAHQRISIGSTDRVVVAARRGLLVALLLAASTAGGCAHRAYNDVYVENMAAEIRDLEDQIYEFDQEYRVMEQQLDSLRSENARLKSNLPAPSNSRTLRQSSPSPSDGMGTDFFVPRGSAGNNPSNAKPATPSDSGKSAPSPAPSLDIGPASPSNSTPAGPTSPAKPTTPPNNSPSTPSISPPALNPAPLPPPKAVPGANEFNPNDLQPPTIERGEPMPPELPPLKTTPNNPVTMQGDHELELELGQIKLPARFAAARTKTNSDEETPGSAQIHPAAEMPSDTRIVDIKFHPTLCRSTGSDQPGDDNGLYLVLQPYNAAGEFVPLPADLMVLALDLSRDEKQATIGRWTLSSADVKAKMNPIGSSRGIHLSLSFSGPAPQCDRVLVFAYYTLADGRRLVAEAQEVMLNNQHRQSSVWVPRSKSEVRTVGHEAPLKR